MKSTPQIIQTYKNIYNNIISKKEILKERTKQLAEADIMIHTNFVHPKKEYDEVIKNRLRKQWKKIGVNK